MDEHIFKRKILKDVEKFLYTGEVIVIYGARQVGKTSLLKYLINNNLKNEQVEYFDLEFEKYLDLCNMGPEAVDNYLISKGYDVTKKIYLLVDEIQYLKNPTNFIKLIHDHFPSIKLIVSGSSSFEIKRKFKDSLVGRTIYFEMYPLSFEEFLLFKNKNYILQKNNSKIINQELIPLAEEFMIYGSYPRIVLETSEEKKFMLLNQIINTYIKKDIKEIGNIQDIDGFNKLIKILAAQSGQLLNVLEISNTLDISRETINNYLDLLEATFIIKRITPYHKNIRSELSKSPKVFFLDTGLMHLLWLKEFPETINGNVFETFVYLELLKNKKEINFWRTTNKQEIDFIVKEKLLNAIEVKLNFQKAKKTTLNFFSENYKSENFIVGLYGSKNGKYPWELLKEFN